LQRLEVSIGSIIKDFCGFSLSLEAPGGPLTIAILHRDVYAIEIVNSMYEATGRTLPEDLSRWLIGRIRGEKKTDQLESTSKQYGCTKRMIVSVIDSQGPVVWDTYQEFLAAAKLAWQELGADPHLHVSFVTGREALGYGIDDAVYPQLRKRLGPKVNNTL